METENYKKAIKKLVKINDLIFDWEMNESNNDGIKILLTKITQLSYVTPEEFSMIEEKK